jgi:hypothetical protein
MGTDFARARMIGRQFNEQAVSTFAASPAESQGHVVPLR